MRLLAPLYVVLALASIARADVITLDDGSKFEGEIVRETDDEVEIKIPYGSTKLPRSRIAKIEKKASPEQEFQAKRAKLDPKDATGRIDLARWLLEKHFPREKAAELAVEAWRIAPGDEGAIDVLAIKLDYHYEKDVWVDADHWYPAHGYVRKGTTGFITLEEQTALDATALIVKLKASLAEAEALVKRADDAIATAPVRELRAKKATDDLETDEKALSIQRETAKVTLDARETDLRAAVDQTLAARRDLTIVERSACPTDAAGKQAWNQRCLTAQALVNVAALEELRVRKLRDAALADVDTLSARELALVGKLKAARATLDAIRADTKAAETALPGLKVARDAAAERLAQGVATEKSAKAAADKRKAQDVKDAADRLVALRALKK